MRPVGFGFYANVLAFEQVDLRESALRVSINFGLSKLVFLRAHERSRFCIGGPSSVHWRGHDP